MSEKLNIEELFASKMEGSEIAPSPGTFTRIRNSVRWKRFLHFDGRSLNIYYVAGALVIGAGIATLSTRNTPVAVAPQPVQTQVKAPVEPTETEKENNAVAEVIEQVPENPALNGPVESERAGRMEETKSNLEEETAQGNLQEKANPSDAGPEPSVEVVSTVPKESMAAVAYFTSSVSSGCAPLTVEFKNQSVNSSECSWRIEGEELDGIEDPTFTFRSPGKHNVTLSVKNSEGQLAEYQEVIEVYPAPRAEFEIEKGIDGGEGHLSLSLINYSKEAVSFAWELTDRERKKAGSWSANEYQPSVRLSEIGQDIKQVRLMAENEFGCIDTFYRSIPVVVESSRTRIKYPTAFSPNPLGPTGGNFGPGERRIDIFHPILKEEPSEYHLRIYTRRGELVFESMNPYKGWDGYLRQQRASGGVYVWMAEGVWDDGEEFSLRGDVTLLWNDIW